MLLESHVSENTIISKKVVLIIEMSLSILETKLLTF